MSSHNTERGERDAAK
jgi:hypothetical protein